MDGAAAHLRRLDSCKRSQFHTAAPLGEAMLDFFHGQVERRQSRLAILADAWCRLVPESLLQRSALESYHRGRLTVVVDSAPHLYQLRQVLLAGLERQLLASCRGAGLRRITLKHGTWYDHGGRPRF
jgi:hypothetical protein